MKSDNVILGWLSLNGILSAIKTAFSTVEPYLSSILTVSQIVVAIATVILIVWKIRAEKRKVEDND